MLLDQLTEAMSPYVFFEIGRARVVPFVERPLTSFVHDFLERRGQLKDYTDNRAFGGGAGRDDKFEGFVTRAGRGSAHVGRSL